MEARAAFDEAARLQEAGGYADAIPRSEHALALREAVLGGEHPEVASSLSQVGNLLARRGSTARAESLLRRALDIQQASLGRNHPEVARTLNHLGRLYSDRGENTRAEPLYERALHIQQAAHGKEHPDVARTLGNLARLSSSQGRDLRAESLHERALIIQKKTLGQEHPDVAHTLNELANIYARRGLYARAEPLHVRALTLMEKALGDDHPDVACALNNLAFFYSSQGFHAWAEPSLRRAVDILEAALGKNHPKVASALNNLALVYFNQGLNDQAEPLLTRALAIQAAALGTSHPKLARSLDNLGWLRVAQQRLPEAVPLLTRAFALSEQNLRRESLGLSESRLSSFLQNLRMDEEHIYSLLRAHPEDAGVQRLALTAVLLRKGRSVEELANTSRAIYNALGEKDRATFEQLRDLRAQVAALSLEGPGTTPFVDYQRRLTDLTARADALEAELAQRSASVRALTALPPPEELIGRVAAALPPNSALVEWVAWLDRPLGSTPGTLAPPGPSQLRYLALVLFADGGIRAVDLGPAAPIDRAARELRGALARRDSGHRRAEQALYALAFEPLRPLLGNVRRVFLAPDGQLGLAPFVALHDGQRFLIDSFDLSYLTSGRDLLPRADGVAPSSSVVVLAAPDFTTPTATSEAPAPSGSWHSASVESFVAARDASLANPPWPPLPGALQEAEAIQRRVPRAQVFLGKEASRQRLLGIKAPGVLHIATHGGYLQAEANAPIGTRAVGHFGGLNGSARVPPPEDPLLRSGLILAGERAAHPGATGANSSRVRSSMVTALELAGLDLWGTQLVVLSACDTGRGDVKLGQGIYGLRRAFIIAGAETVVMSLWKVNDDSTRLLMDEYYRHLLAGRGRTEALNLAMRKLRETHPHPYHWAPFIAVGRDGPLQLAPPNP